MPEETTSTPKPDEAQGGKPQEQSGDKPTGTTAALFPEYFETPTPEATPEVKPEEAKKVEAKPEDEIFTIDHLKGKKVKVKIDGEEKIVNAEDLWKGYQTDQHLSKKGQQLSEERRAFLAEKARLESLAAQTQPKPTVTIPEVPEDNPWKQELDPFIRPLKEQIASLEAQLANVGQVIAPVNYQNTIEKLDTELKKEGFEDFKTYLPKVEEYILDLPPNLQKTYDNAAGFATVYKHLKSSDLMRELKELKEQKASTPVQADARPKPSVTVVETGSNAHSDVAPSQQKYREAFKKAQQTNDWTEVLQLKGVI